MTTQLWIMFGWGMFGWVNAMGFGILTGRSQKRNRQLIQILDDAILKIQRMELDLHELARSKQIPFHVVQGGKERK